MTLSHVILVPPDPFVNGRISAALISPTDSFTDEFVPADMISVGTREVGSIDLLLVSVDETTKDLEHLSDYEEDRK